MDVRKGYVSYSDFGAVGDGVADDFYAVRAAHAYANEHALPVRADEGCKYRFGRGSGTDTITVMTDTCWRGARLIFDDSEMQYGMPEYTTPIFTVSSSHTPITYDAETSPIKSIKKGSTNIGFATGYRAMVILYNDEVRQYIRNAGIISDNGTAQHEFVMVDKDGNIDPTTPLQWTYDKITSLEVVNVEDAPITISGGEGEEQSVIETVSNHSEAMNRYLSRVIRIQRSNTTFRNIRHEVTNEELSDVGAPYAGFTHTQKCENITYERLTFQRYKVFDTHYRSYEIRGTLANRVVWRNSNMSNFFSPDGYTVHQGMMGTNYCKNLEFDNVEFNTFDCHHGCYNVTLRNSRLVYVSAIGEGEIRVENCEFYLCKHCIAIWLRSDYGATWYGDMYLKNITAKYSDRNPHISLVNAWWDDHWYGYPAKLPTNVYLDGLKLVKYEAEVDGDGNRTERVVERGSEPIYFFTPNLLKYTDVDISRHVSEGGFAENNPYEAPDNIYVKNVGELELIFPETPMFKKTKIHRQ